MQIINRVYLPLTPALMLVAVPPPVAERLLHLCRGRPALLVHLRHGRPAVLPVLPPPVSESARSYFSCSFQLAKIFWTVLDVLNVLLCKTTYFNPIRVVRDNMHQKTTKICSKTLRHDAGNQSAFLKRCL